MESVLSTYRRIDRLNVSFMNTWGIRLLRLNLAVVFIWFGALKVLNLSPVADLVAQTLYWLPSAWVVPFLGWWEIAIGLGLLFRVALRFTLLLFFLQMPDTFLVLILHPDLSFQNGNPLVLTVLGEFVVKNLVLLSAGLVVGSTVDSREPREVPPGA